jgi:hypothetical protein
MDIRERTNFGGEQEHWHRYRAERLIPDEETPPDLGRCVSEQGRECTGNALRTRSPSASTKPRKYGMSVARSIQRGGSNKDMKTDCRVAPLSTNCHLVVYQLTAVMRMLHVNSAVMVAGTP